MTTRLARFHVKAAAAIAMLCIGGLPASAATRAIVGYYPSWCGTPILPRCEPDLAQVSPAYTHVVLAFARPDFAWDGKSWTGTGLQFRKSPDELKPVIAALRNRGTHIVLAVGGMTYLTWAPLAAEADAPGPITKALARLIAALGIDGLDVDYEAEGTDPQQIAEYSAAIRAMHRATEMAGAGKMLTLAAWSTGADCTPATGLEACGGKTSQWEGRAGRERLLFRDQSLIPKLSMVSIMTYDAGTENFDAVTAYALYREMLPASVPLNVGFEIAPEGWGDGRLVADAAHAICPGSMIAASQFGTPLNAPYAVDRIIADGPLARRRNSNPRDGVMLWNILKYENLPVCGGSAVISPIEFEQKARALLDRRQDAGGPAYEASDVH